QVALHAQLVAVLAAQCDAQLAAAEAGLVGKRDGIDALSEVAEAVVVIRPVAREHEFVALAERCLERDIAPVCGVGSAGEGPRGQEEDGQEAHGGSFAERAADAWKGGRTLHPAATRPGRGPGGRRGGTGVGWDRQACARRWTPIGPAAHVDGARRRTDTSARATRCATRFSLRRPRRPPGP